MDIAIHRQLDQSQAIGAVAKSESRGFFAYHGVWAPGVRLFRNLRFAAKAAIISAAFVVPMLFLIGWQLNAQYERALQAKMDATREHVEIAHGLLVAAHEQEKAGKLDRAQAQQLAMRSIAPLRYSGSEYFWINDMQPRMVMHPIKPELDGKPLGDMKDPNGFALFSAFVDVVRRSGAGFVSYQWPKPGSTTPVDKISYVKGFEPWGWVVGSGIYVGNIKDDAAKGAVLNGGVIAASLLVAGYLFLSFYRVMDGGLRETSRHLAAMASGDLTTSPSPWGHDEAARLMLDLRKMQDALRDMVVRVRRSSDDIVHSSGEIASGALDLQSRTEQAAANLEESAAAMEEISSTVRTTSENTAEASKEAQANAAGAAAGSSVMEQVIATMEQIRNSSAKIGEIIGTIDGIAFQTNILALNAAVEAARAGEEGRGFAVVAGEVRTLAKRSADAAREIKTLIQGSVDLVESGTNIVRRAGATIDDIVVSSEKVNNLLGEIATGAREQSLGIGQIGQAVQDLDRMTQQNAALVEETAAAASAMKGQAQTLSMEVAKFRVPDSIAFVDTLAVKASIEDFDFDGAIDAHRQWKVKLRKAIANSDKLDADSICRDDRCALGKWIHGPGGSRWGSKPVFVELRDKHAEFHRVAADVARAIQRGNSSDAERLIGSGSAFARVSSEVAMLILSGKRGF